MIEVTSFAGQNWLITPAARAVNEAPPNSISDQAWLLVLSGVAIVNLEAKTADDRSPTRCTSSRTWTAHCAMPSNGGGSRSRKTPTT